MDAIALAALWQRSKTIVGVVSRRAGEMVFVEVEGQPYSRALTRARNGWRPSVGERVELGGTEVPSTEHADRRLRFEALFARKDGRVHVLMDEPWIRAAFPDALPPLPAPPPPSRPSWLDTLGRHGLIDPETVDAAWFGLEPSAILLETYERAAGFARGVVCYGRWMQQTEDPIADLARIAEQPAMFRTVRLDPEDREKAVFEATIDGLTKPFVVELTNDLMAVVGTLNQCLSRAHASRRIFVWRTEGAYSTSSVFLARTPDEIHALVAELPGAELFAP